MNKPEIMERVEARWTWAFQGELLLNEDQQLRLRELGVDA